MCSAQSAYDISKQRSRRHLEIWVPCVMVPSVWPRYYLPMQASCDGILGDPAISQVVQHFDKHLISTLNFLLFKLSRVVSFYLFES